MRLGAGLLFLAGPALNAPGALVSFTLTPDPPDSWSAVIWDPARSALAQQIRLVRPQNLDLAWFQPDTGVVDAAAILPVGLLLVGSGALLLLARRAPPGEPIRLAGYRVKVMGETPPDPPWPSRGD